MAIIPVKGSRTFIAGTTGSGKTAFLCWLLKRLEDDACPVIIYDVKVEPKFEALHPSIVVENAKQAFEVAEEGLHDYIIVRPSLAASVQPEILDDMLLYHYHFMHGKTAVVDEAYPFHKNSQAGPGLTGLMTRGRSKGITTIIGSQRPQRISRFLITESENAFIFRLRDKLDRKRIDDISEDFSKLPKLEKHFFYHIDGDNADAPTLYKPVKLDDELKTGYTDESASDANSVPEPTEGIWI